MEQILEHKKDIFLVFLIGLSLAIMTIYQTYAYDINTDTLVTTRPSPDLKYTFNLENNTNIPYTITINPGETKLLDLTLDNNNSYNLKYALYTKSEIKENTVLAVLDNSEYSNSSVIPANSSATISLIAINKTSSPIIYELSYLSGYENGGDLNLNEGTLITDIYSFTNSPELDDNMIPIVYDDELSSWVTADITNTDYKYYWYEYALQRWANIAIIDKSNILDISNHENTGKNNNTTIDNGIVTLNSNESSIDCGLSNYEFKSNLTAIVRAKITNLNGEANILSNLNNGGFSIYLTTDNYIAVTIFSDEENTEYNFKSNYKAGLNEWYTIALTYNGNKPNLYLNGQKLELTEPSNSLKGNIKASNSSLILGNSAYRGDISDFLIFNTNLSESVIKEYFSTTLDSTNILNNLNETSNKLLLYYDFSSGKNIPTGTLIKDDNSKENGIDIKAFYTWIPRYKYRVWNIEKQSGQTTVLLDNKTYDPYTNGIDIIFESGTDTTGTITCTTQNTIPTTEATLSEVCLGKNGEFYTHPAFTLGNTELTGIWVGKYETTLNSNNNIIIKNNLINNAVNHNLSEIWSIANNMTAKDNIYNFSSNLDSHLIKNLEWGAVSYLSNSMYGLCSTGTCTQIGLNNYVSPNKEYQTGCGNTSSIAETTCHSYNTKEGQTASTTGNVYGIYDMAGGATEYVMANILDINNKLQLGNAGSKWNNLGSQYYDSYPNLSNQNGYSQIAFNRSKLGDALGEVSLTTEKENGAWYNSESTFGTGVWLTRGGISSQTGTQFSFNTSTGTADNNIGFRNVLTLK